MGYLYKFSGMLLMSTFAFLGISLLKKTLNVIIPTGSTAGILIRTMPNIIFRETFWLAILCYGAAMTVYLFLLQSDEASKIFTTTVGVNILLTTFLSSFFLKDSIDLFRIIGIFFIITGVFLVNGFHPWK